MARKTRVQYPGAIYHVTARGNGRAVIYKERADFELFLKTLEEALQQFGVLLHAWCLMPNHFHLVMETPSGNLSKMMAWLMTTFAVRYQRAHGRNGHVFQGRYRAEIVDEAAYVRWLILYVHLNPIRSRAGGSVHYTGYWKKLNEWRWSSHASWLGQDKRKIQGSSKKWMNHWGATEKAGKEAYRRAIQIELGEKEACLDWKQEVAMGLVAGGEALKRKVKKLLKGKGRESGREIRESLENENRRERFQKEFEGEPDERIRIWMRVRLFGVRPIDIAQEKGYRSGSAAIHAIVKRVELRAAEEKDLKKKIENWGKVLSVDD